VFFNLQVTLTPFNTKTPQSLSFLNQRHQDVRLGYFHQLISMRECVSVCAHGEGDP
jgi:hypothetical protein